MIPYTLDFETPAEVVSLELQTPLCRVQKGFSLGDEQLDIITLGQAPYGEIDVSVMPKIGEMLVPLKLLGTWAQMTAFHALLATEMKRSVNTLRLIPPGATDEYLIDTFRSPVPTLLRPNDFPTPGVSGVAFLDLIIRRSSELRGAAAYI